MSVQCLTEFFHTVRWRLAEPLSHDLALARVRAVRSAFLVWPLDFEAVAEGCRVAGEYGVAFWDALIWAVAKQNEATVGFTEDLPTRAEIEGVRFINPFLESFRLGDWLP